MSTKCSFRAVLKSLIRIGRRQVGSETQSFLDPAGRHDGVPNCSALRGTAWAAIICFCSCMFATAGDYPFSWRAATRMHFEAEFAHGDGDWVALPPKATSPRATGTFNVVSESKFVLRETEGGVNWTYKGTYVPRLNGMAMRLTLDKSGRAALAKKIKRTVQPSPLDSRVTIESISVHLNTVSQPLLHRPKADEKQKVLLSGTGTYRVVWRYEWVWPLPAYYGLSTWRFDFRESLVVGPGH